MDKPISLFIVIALVGAIALTAGLVGNQPSTNVNVNVDGQPISVDGQPVSALGGSTSSDWNVGGNLSVTGTSAFGSNGTSIVGIPAGTTTWNPGSLGNLGVASTTVTVTSAAAGDPCIAGLTTATTADAVLFSCKVHTANTASVAIYNLQAGTVDYATGTLDVWVLDN